MHQAPGLLFVHILLIVAWLGIDVGVFTSSFVMRRPGMSTETRRTVRELMRGLDLAPRVSLILMIPVSVALARSTGWGLALVPEWIVWSMAVLGVVWVAFTVVAFTASGRGNASAWTAKFNTVDVVLRGVVAIGFLATGLWSLVGDGPWNAAWIGWKATIFGAIVALGLWIRVAAGRYRPALTELLEKGESPQRLAAVNERIRGVYPPVLLIWASLVLMTGIAIWRP